MANSIAHGVRSTANQVLAGIDLTGKCILVTGCNSGIGFETISALAANGARVIGLARSWTRAKDACAKVGPRTIGWRATLIPLLAVPVSLVGTFAFFPLFGFSINTLSMFGMVLAIGLVVDDAIVVVEAVERHIEN